jgi:hypothetical protein
MTNLTLTVDDLVLRQARLRALAEGTSVNALVRDYISTYAQEADGPGAALGWLLELSDRSIAASGPGGRTWTRDELYDA